MEIRLLNFFFHLSTVYKFFFTFYHQDLLFLRLLSLPGGVSFSLFRQFVLQGFSRDGVSWVFSVSEFISVVRSSCSELQQQVLPTGKASSVNVCVWNRGEQANRALTASCSRRLFFCCSGWPLSTSTPAHRKHSSFNTESQQFTAWRFVKSLELSLFVQKYELKRVPKLTKSQLNYTWTHNYLLWRLKKS